MASPGPTCVTGPQPANGGDVEYTVGGRESLWALGAAGRPADHGLMVETLNSVTCHHCGERVDVHGVDRSLRYVTREAAAGVPRTFVIIGTSHAQHTLLHACTDKA